jgi:hypothetical protein
MRGTLVTTAKKTQDAVNEIEAFFARKELLTSKAWRPEPGDTLIGEIVGFRSGVSEHKSVRFPDGIYPIVIIRPKDGGDTVSVHAFHTLLVDGLQEIKVAKGMRVAINYDGRHLKNSAADIPEKDRKDSDHYEMYFVADLDALATDTEIEVNPFA